jgi:DNA-binding HxlR family transcriptional regulator
MRWYDLDNDVCSVTRTMSVLGDAWTILVLREVFNGVRRFADIAEHIGVSRSVLTQRLTTLVEHGILERRPYQEPGDRVRHEYRLTQKGWGLQPVLVSLMTFGDEHLAEPAGPPAVLRHTTCGGRITARLVCEHDHIVGKGEARLEQGPGARPRAS